MNFKEEYGNYAQIYEKLVPFGECIPYDWVISPKPWPKDYRAYCQMIIEHPYEIANSINQLRKLTLSLKAWDELQLSKSDDQQRFELIIEFIDPLATVAINLPYVIRSRFIYSIVHLCHQANQANNTLWKDDFPIDSEIYFKQADKHGVSWRSYKPLKLALEKITARQYKEETLDFRNKYNHRYSPKIEIGLTQLVTRHVEESGQISYGYRSIEPLKLPNIVGSLKQQHEFCTKAFGLYQKLVEEHIAAIKTHS